MILDTCTLLWLVAQDERLSSTAKSAIDDASQLHVPAICAFEIGLKHRNGKLHLPLPAKRWYHQALQIYHLLELPLSSDIALLATELPPIHQDPCDRLIIASAEFHHMPIITCDRKFEPYGVDLIW